jgi:hypothetical protein
VLRLRQVIFGGQDEELWAMEVLAVQRQGGVVRGEGARGGAKWDECW